MGDLAAQYEAVRTGVGAVELARDVIKVAGPQALEYLQGQLSQDIAVLAPGDAALSFLLEPQGKVVALLRVARTGDDAFVLDTDGGFGDEVMERLSRFKLRTKVAIEALDWRCVALRGPAAAPDTAAASGAAVVVPVEWPGLVGFDLIGPDVAVPAGVQGVADIYEVVRIEAGIPRMGAELTARTIPQETGVVDRAVSFTKGCYTGQELVARIDARGGNVPRRLRGVIVDDGLPPPGAMLTAEGATVGEITSAAAHPAGHSVALAYVRRGHEPPLAATVAWEGGSAVARIAALPLVS
jgi:folate-binding protein YgfZ